MQWYIYTEIKSYSIFLRPKKICVFPVTRPTLFSFCQIPDLNLFFGRFQKNFRKTTCFFCNRLFYYKIVMAVHLLAATSWLAVRINKCQHLVVDKNAIICIENCLYTFIIRSIHIESPHTPPSFKKNHLPTLF